MANRRWMTRLAAALLGSAGFGLAFAEDAAPPAPPADAELEVTIEAGASGGTQLEQAQSILQRGAAISTRLTAILDEARRTGDIIMVTCVNDKLTQVNAQLRSAEGRVRALETAQQAGDSARASHEYTVLVVLGQRLASLEREANMCVGQDIFTPGGASSVDSTVDPGTAAVDPKPTIPEQPSVPTVPVIPPPDSAAE